MNVGDSVPGLEQPKKVAFLTKLLYSAFTPNWGVFISTWQPSTNSLRSHAAPLTAKRR